MSDLSDTSSEMYPNGLTPDAAERLCNGEIDSPEFGDLTAMVSELRALPGHEATPVAGPALSEFVGTHLATNEIPTPRASEPAIDVREGSGVVASSTRRKKTVFAQIAAFVGTVGGKAAVCGAVAAASVTGGHAAGVVDVPGLPEVGKEEVTTIDDPTEPEVDVEVPEAVAAVDEDASAKDTAEEAEAEAERLAAEKAEAEAKAKAEAERLAAEEAEAKAEAERLAAEKAAEEAEAEAERLAAEEAEAEAKAKAEAERLAAEEAEAKSKAEADEAAKDEHDKDADHAKEESPELTDAQIDAKIADLESIIAWCENDLEKALDEINTNFAGWVAEIEAEIDNATSDEEIAEWEAYLENKYRLWDEAIAQKTAEKAKAVAPLKAELEELRAMKAE